MEVFIKKTISVILALFVLFGSALAGCAAENEQAPEASDTTVVLKIGNPEMTVNGVQKQIDEQGTVPVVINGRTLLPVRAVIEELGGKVSWSEESREITLNCGADEIKLTADSGTAYLNGEAQMLDTAPTIINSRTMLPIRFIAESFKFGVDWNEKAQTVTITKSAGQAPSENNPAQPADKPDQTSKSLVVYFSATGNTKALAEKIAAESKSDIFEIVPKIPYTSEDLNYNNTDCRANTEQHDDSARPEISKMPENIADYDVIFIGYPIWWGTMPKIINTFLDSCDLSGKTVMPFYTSGGSGISASVTEIKKACPDADVRDGFKGSSGTSSAQLQSWLDGLQSKPQN